MSMPLIGILPLYDSEKESYWMLPGYMKAVEQAGGIPVMLPLTGEEQALAALARSLDGFLFTGGHDVDPALYGEEIAEACGELCRERDRMEAQLFRLALELDKPAFGICRGLQLFNVLLGGTLHQDLPSAAGFDSAIGHKQRPPYDNPAHPVQVEPGSQLRLLVGSDRLHVNSYHHQGIKALAPSLAAAAKADDGLIEAVELPGKAFVAAVQWHPEFSYESEPSSRALFAAFVGACRSA
ncbi:gamma-glutamyl-gamma-aminobutyrate hydrolase family protein [Paenibacillus pasadenensis]|uniref:Para-aminobenzoate synthase, amidotransferase component n=1 Tax=Paenibacillus pasadenensis TaxID=217090 RepID=A0A2N5ND48_9BACL|nr:MULTISPECIES: gamma-glutamyl-gamma-aminobutyrate hydrolase family protein [Paenibacillus]PLT48253.1 Para-aminobenzoate synthase, amidotransferase component [Paenibacillus pasadenensis]QGG58244.1 amidotransferase [Paenibacillus sp. B01]